MAFYTDTFMTARREQLLRAVQRFQYQINGSAWYDGEVNKKAIEGNAVVCYVNVPSSGSADTITGARVYDNNGALAGSQSVSLARKSINSALLRFTFPLIETT
jgi:hypothetical protein